MNLVLIKYKQNNRYKKLFSSTFQLNHIRSTKREPDVLLKTKIHL